MPNQNQQLTVSMYHYTRELQYSRYPQIKGMDLASFRKQLSFFKENFNVVRMEEVIEAIKGKYTLPEKALLLTFDDGYVDNYTYALPLLEEYGFQGSFFIPGKPVEEHCLLDVNKIHLILAVANVDSLLNDLLEKLDYYRGTEYDFPSNDELINEFAHANSWDTKEVIFIKRVLQTALPEKLRGIISSELFAKYLDVSEEIMARDLYLTRDQIRTLKRHGMHIGIHGYSHMWLGRASNEIAQNDIKKALEVMDEFTNHDEWTMNYPYGSYNENVLEFVKKNGAIAGFTTERGIATIGGKLDLQIKRYDCNDFSPKSQAFEFMA